MLEQFILYSWFDQIYIEHMIFLYICKNQININLLNAFVIFLFG